MRRAVRGILLAAAFGLAAQFLFYGQLLGLNAVVATALFLALAWSLRERAIDRVDAWIPAAALMFAGLLALRTDSAVVIFDALAALALGLASVTTMSGRRLTTAPLGPVVREAAAIGAAVAYRAGPLVARARADAPSFGAGYRSAGGYVAGAALAVPFLAVFALLFSSADAVFARRFADLFDPWTAIREAPGRLVVATLAAWVAAGVFTLLAREPRATPPPAGGRPLRAETATVLLLAIDLLFALFAGLQATYLFGGRDTVEAAGITYSAYARRGFFELVGVAVLVTCLLFTLDLVAARTRLVIAAAVALLALTGVVLVSATYRLDLYQNAYGWSELRLYALAAIVHLAAALAIVGVAIVARRTAQSVQPIVMAGLMVALGLNLAAPSAFVARADLDRVISSDDLPEDAETDLDLAYLIRLGDGAVPEIVRTLPALPERERFCLETLLRRHIGRWPLDTNGPWQSWNSDRERARQALLGIRDEVYAPLVPAWDDHALRVNARIEARYRDECARRPPGR